MRASVLFIFVASVAGESGVLRLTGPGDTECKLEVLNGGVLSSSCPIAHGAALLSKSGDGGDARSSRTPSKSCREILERGESAGDGLYTIAYAYGKPLTVFCDMTTQGGGWTRFNWITSGSYPSGADPFGQALSSCTPTDSVCRGRIPSFVEPSGFMIKRDDSYAIWEFSSSNSVSNVALKAMRDHEAGCMINGDAWMPVEEMGTPTSGNCASPSVSAKCDSFYYKKGTAHPPGCSLGGNRAAVGWGVVFDDDTGCGNTAFQLGLSDHKYDNGGEAYGFFTSCAHSYGGMFWR